METEWVLTEVQWQSSKVAEGNFRNFHICTMQSDVIQSFISPTNAQPILL